MFLKRLFKSLTAHNVTLVFDQNDLYIIHKDKYQKMNLSDYAYDGTKPVERAENHLFKKTSFFKHTLKQIARLTDTVSFLDPRFNYTIILVTEPNEVAEKHFMDVAEQLNGQKINLYFDKDIDRQDIIGYSQKTDFHKDPRNKKA